jgi:hypothetical protein
MYLDEIQLELRRRHLVDISIPTITRTLRRMHFSSKNVSVKALERNDTLRAAFMNHIGAEVPDMNMVMFTHESAKDDCTDGQRKGWSLVGSRCVQRHCFIHGHRYSILPILTLDGIIPYDIIEGPVTSERFIQFLREMVVSYDVRFSSTLMLIPRSSPSRIPTPAHVLFSYLTIVASIMLRKFASWLRMKQVWFIHLCFRIFRGNLV